MRWRPHVPAALLAGVAVAMLGPASIAVASTTAFGQAATAAVSPTGQVVVVGVPGLLISDLSPTRTPALWRLAEAGSVGVASVRAVPQVSCPVDGWLTLGAGNRARGPVECPSGLAVDPVGDGAQVSELPELRRTNLRLDVRTDVSAFADTLAAHGACVSAVGSGAAAATADAAGHVSIYADQLPDAGALSAFLARCPVTVVAAEVATVDESLSRLQAARAPGSVLLVVGISEVPGSPAPTAQLHPAVASGPGFDGGALTSASSGRMPYVQLVDVAPTVLSLLGKPAPAAMVGEPWRAAVAGASLDARVAHLADLALLAKVQHVVAPPAFACVVMVELIAYALAWYVLRRWRRPSRRPVLRVCAVIAVAATAAPAAMFLANLLPWWRSAHPLVAVIGVVAAFTAALTALAYAGPWRRNPAGPAAAAAGLTTVLFAVDLTTGARLQMASLPGYSPLVAGRFAGMGNVALGILVAASLLSVAALASWVGTRAGWRAAAWTAAAAGLAVVALDGSPQWGRKFGGVLALVPAFAFLTWQLAGLRTSWRKVSAAAVGTVVAVGAVCFADYSRPAADQTHLGRFAGELLHGGAWTVVRRKALANWHLLTHSPLTLLVPVLLIALTVLVCRPSRGLRRAYEDVPVLRTALLAVLVASVVGFAANDSGVAVPALAMMLTFPAVLSAVLGVTAARDAPESGSSTRQDTPQVLP